MSALMTDGGGTVPHRSAKCITSPMTSTRPPPKPNASPTEPNPNPLGEQTSDEDATHADTATTAAPMSAPPATMMARLVRCDILSSGTE